MVTDSRFPTKRIRPRVSHGLRRHKQWVRHNRVRDALDGISNIPVKVHPKKTKLVTDALSGFDDV